MRRRAPRPQRAQRAGWDAAASERAGPGSIGPAAVHRLHEDRKALLVHPARGAALAHVLLEAAEQLQPRRRLGVRRRARASEEARAQVEA